MSPCSGNGVGVGVCKPDWEPGEGILSEAPDSNYTYFLPANIKLKLSRSNSDRNTSRPPGKTKIEVVVQNLWWSHLSPFLQLENHSRPCLSPCLQTASLKISLTGWNESDPSTEPVTCWPHTTGQRLTQESALRKRARICLHFNSLHLPPQAHRRAWRKENVTQMSSSPTQKKAAPHHCPRAGKPGPASYRSTGALIWLEPKVTN